MIDLGKLKEEYVGKYCISKSKKQIYKILNLEIRNRTLYSMSVYAIVEVIFGFHPSPHVRPLNNLFVLNDSIVSNILSIKESIKKMEV